jgi:hypothetical protein
MMFNGQSKLMKRFRILAVCLVSTFAVAVPAIYGQTNAPVAQNSVRVTPNNNANVGKGHRSGPVSQAVSRGAVGISPRTGYSRQTQIVGQHAANLRPNYSPPVRPVNPTLAAMSARQSARSYNMQPDAGGLAKNDIARRNLPITNDQRVAGIYRPQRARDILARREIPRGGLTTPNTQNGGEAFQSTPDAVARETQQSNVRHNWHGKTQPLSYSDALRCHRQWHDRNWWKRHFTTTVFVSGGYYFWDAGYWYPAWGYDPVNSYYDYDGPIYTYGNLLPDEVIANVQVALQDAGYYFGAITGSLNVETRAALANFQRDYGLPITGAIDQPTIETLGLY